MHEILQILGAIFLGLFLMFIVFTIQMVYLLRIDMKGQRNITNELKDKIREIDRKNYDLEMEIIRLKQRDKG